MGVEIPSWLVTGLDSKLPADPNLSAGASVRFWMPKGSERQIIFLVNGVESISVFEHNVRLNGHWRNWFTCLKVLGRPCPLCDWADSHRGEFKRYPVTIFSVIDTHSYEDRAGKKHSNERRLLCCKSDTADVLKRKWLTRIEAGQDLRGAMFKVFRSNGDKSPGVGDDFEFTRMVDLASFPESEPLDVAELVKPDGERVRACVDRLRRGLSDESPAPFGSGSSGVEGTDITVSY